MILDLLRARTALLLLTTGVLTATIGPPAPAAGSVGGPVGRSGGGSDRPAFAATTLGAAAATTGRYFGARVADGRLPTAPFGDIVNREFSSVTTEQELVWSTVEPQRGQFNFAPAERVVAYAAARGMLVRGHSLAWHSQLPAWAYHFEGPALRAVMVDHIRTVAGHFAGRLHSWDVVSEAFDERGVRRHSNLQRTGDDWVEVAFRTARDADPSARLCYDDYFIEGDSAKTAAVYAMVSDFRARGVPIDCVGFQGHFLSNFPMPPQLRDTLELFAALGVQVQLNELDVLGTSTQPEVYASTVRACLAVPGCVGLTVNSVRDSDSWRSNELPALFDRNGDPKPAYHATLAALNEPGTQAGPPDGRRRSPELSSSRGRGGPGLAPSPPLARPASRR